jgi:exo-beta-1,3-glucanase (GH17 family)
MDVLAISTYPFLGDARSAADIRADYYSQLTTRWDGEIIIAETAYPSAPVEGRVNVGTESDQTAYLNRLLTEANDLGFGAVFWFAALDPAFAGTGATSVFKDIGLRRADGSNKAAWALWEEWARRPVSGE